MSPIFFVGAGVLILVTLAFLVWPLWRQSSGRDASRQALNAAIYKDQLAEMERDRAAGTLAETEYEQAKQELQRRLLEDAQEADAQASLAPARKTAMVLAGLLPIAAAALYLWLGHPEALAPQANRPSRADITPQQVDEMVAKLAAKLEQNPDNPKGWAMLARSYKALHRFDEAEKAYGHLQKEMETDPDLLVEVADLIATKQENLDGKPMDLLNKALKLDPKHGMALMLSGTAAYQRHDIPAAIGYWDRLLKVVPPDSEDAANLSRMLTKLRAGQPLGEDSPLADEASKAAPTAETAPPAPGKPASGGPETISGQAVLAPALVGKVQPGDTVFVFARPVSGSRMPLAVVRARAGDLPLTFNLDDSLSMSPQALLSQAKEVKLEVRVSRSGDAMPKSGDLTGEISPIKPGSKDLKITIDKVLP